MENDEMDFRDLTIEELKASLAKIMNDLEDSFAIINLFREAFNRRGLKVPKGAEFDLAIMKGFLEDLMTTDGGEDLRKLAVAMVAFQKRGDEDPE